MSIYYYTPNLPGISAAKVRALGLGYTIGPGLGHVHRGFTRGPAGSGVVWSPYAKRIPDTAGGLDWQPMPGVEGVWMAVDREDPPGPEAFRRKDQVLGHSVQLGDGNLWVIPVARAIDGTTMLPVELRWSGTEWTSDKVEERYQELWVHACRVFDAICGETAEGDEPVTLHVEADVAAQALAINYRIGPAEISALGLFNSNAYRRVMLALCDFETLKKKLAEQEQVTSSPGAGA